MLDDESERQRSKGKFRVHDLRRNSLGLSVEIKHNERQMQDQQR